MKNLGSWRAVPVSSQETEVRQSPSMQVRQKTWLPILATNPTRVLRRRPNPVRKDYHPGQLQDHMGYPTGALHLVHLENMGKELRLEWNLVDTVPVALCGQGSLDFTAFNGYDLDI
jgi:hypothetical protein